MKTSVTLIFFSFLFTYCGTGEIESPLADNEAEKEAIHQTIADWLNKGVAELDTIVAASYMTPTFGTTETADWYDRDSFLEWILTFEEDFGGPFTLEYEFSEWHTATYRNVAWTSMRNNGVLTVEGQEPRHLAWTEMAVLLKQPDGRWLIDRYHSTYLGDQP